MAKLNKQEKVHAQRIFDKSEAALFAEKKDLEESFQIARNLACTEWKDGMMIPTVSGGRFGWSPNKMLPDTMGLLHINFNRQMEDIFERLYTLDKLRESTGTPKSQRHAM